jgi:hypothetical protein
MRLTSTRTTSLVASAALAGGLLAIGAGSAASQPVASQSTVGHASSTTGDHSPPVGSAPAQILPGDIRVWELTHGYSAAASGLLPGDVRVWELQHPWRG